MKSIIAPSALSSDFGHLTAECKRMIKNGADWLHMDVMDGHFVPNLTIGAPVLSSVKKGIPDIFMDCHMMVSQPERWVDDIAAAGGASYTFHYEATNDHMDIIEMIHEHNMRAGIAISPDTPSTVITDEIANAVDMILVMTVNPGRGGQKFMARCMPKVSELRARFPDKDIQVDGGVSTENIETCADAGSNVIVAGTSIFMAQDPSQVISTLRAAVDAAITSRKSATS
ncbi:ribulose-5-phosphate 3-epimerase [Rhizoctonia solani AG-3 Rhs1AP]|uniref:Ribulose-phosphate 3-epimerase n=1 Tax=Rhizoctonia solani AG-3 Rhs1AP TaxID=1086054 RepID=X8JMZ3_9AGAM|nr:ribulose-5-phosphate 3-epimerase [Rhizoctonia solani AG-3 Rhs1AP]